MEESFDKPKVFLSCSEKDLDFIDKLEHDLRKCQIEPWLYTYEIRHGKPWMDSIFKHGIPTCHAIIVYLTEDSLSSRVVSKEIDAGILQTLSDSNVAFLPYVKSVGIRKQLRSDLQTLQIPEWNNDNYSSLLPIVVSEIWRSYLESVVSSVSQQERLKRIEAELELEKYKNQPKEPFSPSENKEFEFIWNSFDRTANVLFYTHEFNEEKNYVYPKKYASFSLHLSTVVALLSNLFKEWLEFDKTKFTNSLFDIGIKTIIPDFRAKEAGIFGRDKDHPVRSHNLIDVFYELKRDLLTYGLIQNIQYHQRTEDYASSTNEIMLTDKYHRYRYWLEYNEKLPDHIVMEVNKIY